MWYEIFKFELQYRKKRPATYIYFVILFLLSFGAMSSDVVQIGGGAGLVKENSPVTIATMMAIMTFAMGMITSAIMGVAVLRDFEHKTESLMFSNPITKQDYLLGRFLGSFIVVLLIFTGIPVGFMLGEFMPWRDADKLLPFNFWNYLQPYLLFVVPNVLFTGALFFAVGALSRKMIVIYTQWVLLFVFYQVSAILIRDIENRDLAALLDPFALRTVNIFTQYWTVAEQNSMVVPFEGTVMWNRIIWTVLGFVAIIATYFGFSFNVVRNSNFKKKAIKAMPSPVMYSAVSVKFACPSLVQMEMLLPELRAVVVLKLPALSVMISKSPSPSISSGNPKALIPGSNVAV